MLTNLYNELYQIIADYFPNVTVYTTAELLNFNVVLEVKNKTIPFPLFVVDLPKFVQVENWSPLNARVFRVPLSFYYLDHNSTASGTIQQAEVHDLMDGFSQYIETRYWERFQVIEPGEIDSSSNSQVNQRFLAGGIKITSAKLSYNPGVLVTDYYQLPSNPIANI